MRNLLYIIAILSLVSWAVLYFGFHGGTTTHVLLFIGLIAILLRIIQDKSLDEPIQP